MSCNTLWFCFLLSTASSFLLTEGTRFSRTEVRCNVFCGNRDSEDCRVCNARMPMRFGKRAQLSVNPFIRQAKQMEESEPNLARDLKILALIEEDIPDVGYRESEKR